MYGTLGLDLYASNLEFWFGFATDGLSSRDKAQKKERPPWKPLLDSLTVE
ncbi:MAG: hypothetical protein ACI9UK_000185 [Candidatus Krumholzibacteriia bacterium]|jgi:hypothetical protein